MQRILTLIVCIFLMPPVQSSAGNHPDELRQIADLGQLTDAPHTHPAPDFTADGGITPLYYESLPYRGKPTRVFAWLGFPGNTRKPVPAIVLVHGGGGTAFREWVQLWNSRGYAAISIAVEGQTAARSDANPELPWQRHAWAGPARAGIYEDSDQPLVDQWIYHAVADTILANSLMCSLPEVDAARVGIMGVSWGGVITSTVIGIDARFAFAIAAYGCGDLAHAANQYGDKLTTNALYREAWDPMLRLERARMPTLWLSWIGDEHFPLDQQAASYRSVAGPHMVSLIPGMGHNHQAAWTPPDSYAFADSSVTEGRPWCLQTGLKLEGGSARVTFASSKPIDSAVLTWSRDSGVSNERNWSETPATIQHTQEGVSIMADVPAGCTSWFILLKSGNLHACSDYQAVTTGH